MVTQYVHGEVRFGACVAVTCPPCTAAFSWSSHCSSCLVPPSSWNVLYRSCPSAPPTPCESASCGLRLGLQRYGHVFAK